MKKTKFIVLFLSCLIAVIGLFPCVALANDTANNFDPATYWSSENNGFKTRLTEYSSNNGYHYSMIFYDNTDDTYLCFYNCSIVSSAPKVDFVGKDTQRLLPCAVGYKENKDTQGTWAIKYDYKKDVILLPTDNGKWAEYSTLTTGSIYNYINGKKAYIGHTNNYTAITNTAPGNYTDSLNNFYTTITKEKSTNNLDKLNVNYGGVLKEIVSLLPVLLPVIVSFIAIRKGLSFVLSETKSL